MSDIAPLSTPEKRYELSFTLKGLPKLTNGSRTHWRVKHAHALKWKLRVSLACHGRKPREPLSKAHVRITRCSSVEPDFDGLVSGGKHLIDGLVECGVLVGDKMSVIGRPEYLWEKRKPRDGHVIVEVKSI
jgi:hypothetical protein